MDFKIVLEARNPNDAGKPWRWHFIDQDGLYVKGSGGEADTVGECIKQAIEQRKETISNEKRKLRSIDAGYDYQLTQLSRIY